MCTVRANHSRTCHEFSFPPEALAFISEASYLFFFFVVSKRAGVRGVLTLRCNRAIATDMALDAAGEEKRVGNPLIVSWIR